MIEYGHNCATAYFRDAIADVVRSIGSQSLVVGIELCGINDHLKGIRAILKALDVHVFSQQIGQGYLNRASIFPQFRCHV
jgi:hypothetical protein